MVTACRDTNNGRNDATRRSCLEETAARDTATSMRGFKSSNQTNFTPLIQIICQDAQKRTFDLVRNDHDQKWYRAALGECTCRIGLKALRNAGPSIPAGYRPHLAWRLIEQSYTPFASYPRVYEARRTLTRKAAPCLIEICFHLPAKHHTFKQKLAW